MSTPRAPAGEHPCALYLDHGSARPAYTQGHHRFPMYLQQRLWGEVRLDELVWLCGTCHDNVHGWLYALMGERYAVPSASVPPRARAEAESILHWYAQHSPRR